MEDKTNDKLFDNPISNNFLYSCYYCEDLKTNHRDYYEHHGSREHFGKPMFPTMMEIENNGLKEQGKDWEI